MHAQAALWTLASLRVSSTLLAMRPRHSRLRRAPGSLLFRQKADSRHTQHNVDLDSQCLSGALARLLCISNASSATYNHPVDVHARLHKWFTALLFAPDHGVCRARKCRRRARARSVLPRRCGRPGTAPCRPAQQVWRQHREGRKLRAAHVRICASCAAAPPHVVENRTQGRVVNTVLASRACSVHPRRSSA